MIDYGPPLAVCTGLPARSCKAASRHQDVAPPPPPPKVVRDFSGELAQGEAAESGAASAVAVEVVRKRQMAYLKRGAETIVKAGVAWNAPKRHRVGA